MSPLTWNPIRPLLKPMEDRPGCASGFTVTVKLCVALKLGDPLSATFKVKAFVVPALRDQRGHNRETSSFSQMFFCQLPLWPQTAGQFWLPGGHWYID